jgi:hypothetical protein
MSQSFNEIELAILKWFQTHYGDEDLSAQIVSAKLVKRKWTGAGFFVDIEVSKVLPSINMNNYKDGWPISGPDIQSPDIEGGGGSILWGENGYLGCIEMYAYGSRFNEQVSVFHLAS